MEITDIEELTQEMFINEPSLEYCMFLPETPITKPEHKKELESYVASLLNNR